MNSRTWYVMALLGLVGMTLEVTGLDLSLDPDAEAAQSDYSLSVSCVDPIVVSFSPDIAYSMTVPAATREMAAAPSAISITSALTNPVNGDSNPTVSQASTNAGKLIRFYSRGPYVKIGGVQCTTNSSATLAIYGDGVDDTQYNVAFQSSASTTWADSNQVDHLTSGNAATLFGVNGLLSNAALSDGNDADGIVNGEIAFGGESGTPAYRIFNSVQYLDTSVLNHNETLTYVFTPQ